MSQKQVNSDPSALQRLRGLGLDVTVDDYYGYGEISAQYGAADGAAYIIDRINSSMMSSSGAMITEVSTVAGGKNFLKFQCAEGFDPCDIQDRICTAIQEACLNERSYLGDSTFGKALRERMSSEALEKAPPQPASAPPAFAHPRP